MNLLQTLQTLRTDLKTWSTTNMQEIADRLKAHTTNSNLHTSSTEKNKLANLNIAYGTCSTAAATASKVITLQTSGSWTLAKGSFISVVFSETNSAESPTFNVNNTGAKPVYYVNHQITTSSKSYAGYKDRPMNYIYNGTGYLFVGWGYDTNSTYTNLKLGQAYGVCETAAATVAKVVTLMDYTLVKGGIVSIRFSSNVPANATLNINGQGEKYIYHKNSKIKANVIKAGDTATFIYDSYYRLIAINRDSYTKEDIDTLLQGIENSIEDSKEEAIEKAKAFYVTATINGDSITLSHTYVEIMEALNQEKDIICLLPFSESVTIAMPLTMITSEEETKVILFSIQAGDLIGIILSEDNQAQLVTQSLVSIEEFKELESEVADLKTSIGEQLSHYQPTITGAATTIVSNDLTSSMVLISSPNGKVAASSNITTTELETLNKIKSNIQDQLDGKLPSGLYAGAKVLGGSANSAEKLTTDAGNTNLPVYFKDGIPQAIGYAINENVPKGALFTDENVKMSPTSGATTAYITGTTTKTAHTGAQVFDTGVQLQGNGKIKATTFDGNASTSTKLKTGRKLKVDLSTVATDGVAFDGSQDISISVDGVLPISAGGTGAANVAGVLSNLGITATIAELNYVDGVTSSIQTQLNSKATNQALSDHTKASNPHGITPGLIGAEVAGVAAGLVSGHNQNTSAHSNIIGPITESITDMQDAIDTINELLGSDDVNLDTVQEIVNYIKNNKGDIESIIKDYVKYTDIVNNLTSTATNKPLSANQGKTLKDAFDTFANSVKVFKTIKVGNTSITADSLTNELTLASGGNITISPTTSEKKVTFTVNNGTTSQKGVVKLEDSVTSTSTTTAATPNSVKTAYDKGKEGLDAANGVGAELGIFKTGYNAHKHSFSYIPAGTISQPTFSGTSVTSGTPSSANTTSFYQITGVGSAPSLTATVTNKCLAFTWSAGTIPTRQSVTVPSTAHTHSVTAAGTVSTPTFTGTAATIKSGTPTT